MNKSVYILLISSLFVQCSDDQEAAPANLPNLAPLSGETRTLVESSNGFALDIFRQVYQANPTQNVVLSPLSIDVALHMTTNGATGDTKAEMKQTLGVADAGDDEINRAVRDLSAQLLSMDRRVTLSLANSIWFYDKFTLQAGFDELIQTYYDGRIEGLDFKDPATKDRVNGWVADKTQGKITNLLEEVKDSDVMYLINAIYFKADWQYRFDPKQTQDAPFYLEDGREVMVPTMFSEGVKLRRYYGSSFQLLDIPYGNGQFSLVILLPTDGSLAETISQLNPADLSTWIAEADTLTPQLYLPKFKASFKMDAKGPLMQLGMKLPFIRGEANFSGFFNEVSGEDLFIDRVIHEAMIEVNEAGSEAAAATLVVIGLLSSTGGTPQPAVVRVDRPFAYFIREQHTEAILFAGTMMNPSAAN